MIQRISFFTLFLALLCALAFQSYRYRAIPKQNSAEIAMTESHRYPASDENAVVKKVKSSNSVHPMEIEPLDGSVETNDDDVQRPSALKIEPVLDSAEELSESKNPSQ